MIKVITYGTFDLLHEGHIRLLRRAKALGDYLIVGVTTENFDMSRGKINVQQTLMERMEAVRQTGIADEVIPEEYIGQKIDDIKRYNISIFAIGSDWRGQFDYLNEYCEVVYLPRTAGISSSQLRSVVSVRIGAVGSDPVMLKLRDNAAVVNGVTMDAIYTPEAAPALAAEFAHTYETYTDLLANNDAVYVAVRPEERYAYTKEALIAGKHVISESPIAMTRAQVSELFDLARERGLTLFDSVKTAYSVAFSRLILLIKSGMIGDIKSIDVTCTTLEVREWLSKTHYYTSFTGWGAIALLPILKILGTRYEKVDMQTLGGRDDIYTKADLTYDGALATLHVGTGVKSEGDLRVAGTKGYVYVPAPWWKSGYFEVRFEDATKNRPYFYENDGEGLRMELVHFVRCINSHEENFYMSREVSEAIADMMERFSAGLE